MPIGGGNEHCDVCDVEVPRLGMPMHVEGKRHRKNTKQDSRGGKQAYCDVCDRTMHRRSMPSHEQGKRHLKKAKSKISKQDSGGRMTAGTVGVEIQLISVSLILSHGVFL